MSEQIKLGDLVVVVRGHGCALGKFLAAESFSVEEGRGLICVVCKEIWYPHRGTPLMATPSGSFYETWRLKRIPPLEELDDVATGDLAEQRRIHDAWAKV